MWCCNRPTRPTPLAPETLKTESDFISPNCRRVKTLRGNRNHKTHTLHYSGGTRQSCFLYSTLMEILINQLLLSHLFHLTREDLVSVSVTERLVLSTSGHGVSDSNPAGGICFPNLYGASLHVHSSIVLKCLKYS